MLLLLVPPVSGVSLLGIGGFSAERSALELFTAADKDSDGCISLDEFIVHFEESNNVDSGQAARDEATPVILGEHRSRATANQAPKTSRATEEGRSPASTAQPLSPETLSPTTLPTNGIGTVSEVNVSSRVVKSTFCGFP
ncbi:hypothetical protein CYMTET_48097 [Cymbomonas tetramitiformis]|uniref:EF-hand domain-containing protein n=1 Tax=Cymbomonas tetramitiformis TaxID=36881 RepID=A0AAE0EVH3_9CHLO|nr:hypothetical protein CYMTET_48097 [Cymbomonas tetramitiformis]